MKHKHIYTITTLLLLTAVGSKATAQTGVSLKPRVYLQAALHGLLPAATLMRDDLRAKGLLPNTEPYSTLPNSQYMGNGEMITDPAVLQLTGKNAIVDWVMVELRSPIDLAMVVAKRSALLQRDGDVVDVDGVSPVIFPEVQPGSYLVVIDHRIHLGAMTEEPVQLSDTPTLVDFTDPNMPINCGQHGMVTIGAKRALWGGDLNNDRRFIYQGPGNEVLKIFTTVLYDPANTQLSANYISKGYHTADANMDGKIIYAGQGNDREVLFQFQLSHSYLILNTEMYVALECYP